MRLFKNFYTIFYNSIMNFELCKIEGHEEEKIYVCKEF